MVAGRSPSRGARCERKSRLVKPRTDRRNTVSSESSAIARGSPKRSPATLVWLSPTVMGSVMLCSARAAAIGSWPSRWVASSRRLAWKPTCRSAGRFLEPFADREVPGVVDGGFGSDRSLELVVLLDLGVLVVDVDRGGDLGGEHTGAPPRGGGAPAAQAHAAVKDEAGLVGPAEVEVVADQLLEEHAA